MFPIIHLHVSDPYQRGLIYGGQAKKQIEICVQYYKRAFGRKGMLWPKLRLFVNRFSETIKQVCPEQLRELQGIADGSGQSFEDIMIINARYEISKFPKDPECTTGVVLSEAAADGHVYGFKNWDFVQSAMDHIVILDVMTEEGVHCIGFAEAGQIMRDGVNNRGMAILCNNLQSVNDYAGYALPVTCLRRKVLSMQSYDEAEALVRQVKRTTSNNILLLDAKTERARDFEWQPDGVADEIEQENGILVHANHFVVHPERDALVGRPRNRDVRLRELLMAQHGRIDLDIIKECLKDHMYYTLSICGHPNPGGEAYTCDRMTVSSLICDFTAGKVYITQGPPCCNEYMEFDLS